jgi:hypothetical protein
MVDYTPAMFKVVLTDAFEKWLDGLRDPSTR